MSAFKDGSTHDETAVYSQCGRFRLAGDRLVQLERLTLEDRPAA